jgi:hypothetical protein
MRRDILLLTEMIDAAEQAQQLASGVTAEQLGADRSAATPCSGTSPCSAKPPRISLMRSRDRSPILPGSNRLD